MDRFGKDHPLVDNYINLPDQARNKIITYWRRRELGINESFFLISLANMLHKYKSFKFMEAEHSVESNESATNENYMKYQYYQLEHAVHVFQRVSTHQQHKNQIQKS